MPVFLWCETLIFRQSGRKCIGKGACVVVYTPVSRIFVCIFVKVTSILCDRLRLWGNFRFFPLFQNPFRWKLDIIRYWLLPRG